SQLNVTYRKVARYLIHQPQANDLSLLPSEKIGLSIDEVKLLENSKELSPPQQHAVNLWLLSFYFAGIRFGDLLLLKWDDFKDERLYYRMNKSHKYDSLKIPEKAKAIMEFYSQFFNK